jgi:hypothetical protein
MSYFDIWFEESNEINPDILKKLHRPLIPKDYGCNYRPSILLIGDVIEIPQSPNSSPCE